MTPEMLLTNVLNPPVLFFFLGLVAALLRSKLEIPAPLPQLFSLYLLLCIGFKGGAELREHGLDATALVVLSAAIGMALWVPLWTYWAARRRLDPENSAALAATYGSVSAVTFVVATAFLETLGIPHGGYMVAVMALMEAPAILIGIALARRAGVGAGTTREVLHDALLGGPIVLLLGSFLIGLVSSEAGRAALTPFTTDLYKGVLCLFLLELGLSSGHKLRDLPRLGAFTPVFAVATPLANAALAMLVAHLLGLGRGDALLLVVLSASASYIAVPAAMRIAVPRANPGLYVTMALALTFPFNVLVGLPLYMTVIDRLWAP